MVLLGFKNNWLSDIDNVPGYINVIHHGFDVHLAVGILKLQDGCDYSSLFSKDDQIVIPDENKAKEEEPSEEGDENSIKMPEQTEEVAVEIELKEQEAASGKLLKNVNQFHVSSFFV